MIHALVVCTIWIAACSIASITQYGVDKSRAIQGRRRIPEKSLLLVALAGGWPGALIAQSWFRHKTRKQPYQRRLLTMIALNTFILMGVFWVFMTM